MVKKVMMSMSRMTTTIINKKWRISRDRILRIFHSMDALILPATIPTCASKFESRCVITSSSRVLVNQTASFVTGKVQMNSIEALSSGWTGQGWESGRFNQCNFELVHLGVTYNEQSRTGMTHVDHIVSSNGGKKKGKMALVGICPLTWFVEALMQSNLTCESLL